MSPGSSERRHYRVDKSNRSDIRERIALFIEGRVDGIDPAKASMIAGESVQNALRHAYFSESGVLRIDVSRDEDGYVLLIRDFGRGFTPDEKDESPKEFSDAGGMGLVMMAACADEFRVYSKVGFGTTLEFIFNDKMYDRS